VRTYSEHQPGGAVAPKPDAEAMPGAPGLPDAVIVPDEARRQLLHVARVAVGVASRALPSGALEAAMAEHPVAALCASAFVTLTEYGELRGCMGILDPERPVIDSVAEAAACAARTDPRFRPVEPGELGRMELDVSVLGPLVPLADPLAFRLGIDGVVVRQGGRRGLLLPEVATENGLDRRGMLEIAGRKAGLPAGAWAEPSTTVFAFRTDRFGGPAAG
jgi:AmmeMemoRadiSam system protein A